MKNKKGKFKNKVMGQRKFPRKKVVKRKKCIRKNQCYMFQIKVKEKDGTCCAFSGGWYRLIFNKVLLKANGFKNKKVQTKKFGKC